MQAKIGKTTADKLQPGDRDIFLWDKKLAGFGLKVTPAGRKVYVVQYRVGGGRSGVLRRYTIGEHSKDSDMTAAKARQQAGVILRRAALGEDPAKEKQDKRREGTVAEIADRYLREHVAAHNKASTAGEVTRLVETRIKPNFGRVRVSELSRAAVKAWHSKMDSSPYEANRSLACLSKIMTLAATDWELRADNPCRGVKRFPERKRERYLRDGELESMGKAIAAMEAKHPKDPVLKGCTLVMRLLALTGMRLGEVMGLRWASVDLQRGVLTLEDAKAGARTVALGAPAKVLLSETSQDGEFVAHGIDASVPLPASAFRRFWDDLRKATGIADMRPHDLRHTVGTYAAQAGGNAFIVRDILGHKTMAMTGRYVERDVDPLRATADAVSERVSAAMSGKTADVKKFPRKATG